MNIKKTLTVMMVVSILFMLALAAEAGPFGYHSKKGGMESKLAGLRTLLELRLSDSQQVKMLSIINKYQGEKENLRNSMKEARKSLSAVLDTEPFNEENARKAFKKASAMREEMFVLKAKMMTELKAVLTPEQQKLLQERKCKRQERKKKGSGASPQKSGK